MFNRQLSLLAFLGLLLPGIAQGEQFETFGEYIVHYNAVGTSMLTPEVAKAYKLIRSKNRALLNIAVRKKDSSSSMQDSAVTANVEVSIKNLLGQLRNVDMKEIREDSAIYYIGVFRITDQEIINFNVQVTPELRGETRTVKFQQQFFID
ncbi:MAG: DUF4426 domain-containing protein [Pseudomonadota bacterium]